MFSRTHRVAAGRIHDHNTGAGGRLRIDIVDTSAGSADRPKTCRALKDFPGHLRGGSHNQTVVVFNRFQQLVGCQIGLYIGSDVTALFEDGDTACVDLVADENLH